MTSGSDAYRLLIQPQQDLWTAGYPPYSRNLSYVPSGSPEVTKKLLSDISEIHSVSLKHQAEAFYAYLSAGIHEHGLLSALPVFYTVMEDDEFYLEWIFDRCRFGFDFYENERDSGWFMVMEQIDGTSRFHSRFNGDYHKAVEYALFVIESL